MCKERILDNFCGSSLRSPCVCASRPRSIEYRVTVCVDTFKPQRENRFEFRVDVRQCELLSEMNRERLPLLLREANSNLSLLFATLCVIDIFGVFPIIALPRAIVECGKFSLPIFVYRKARSPIQKSLILYDNDTFNKTPRDFCE